MTIAVGALARDSSAIICVADKSVTYADKTQWDADATKIIPLANGKLIAMFAGAEEPVIRVLGKLAEFFTGFSPAEVKIAAEAAYSVALSELIGADVLSPRGFTWEQYRVAVSGEKINRYMQIVSAAVDSYHVLCDLLLCGFYDDQQPFIGHLRYPGVFTEMSRAGFHAIGTGGEFALNRMLSSESQRKHSLGRVLYDVVYAKFVAEIAIGVGYDTDATIITPDGSFPVPKNVMDLIERAYAMQERSPFEKLNRKEDLPNPPRDWKEQIERELSARADKGKS